MITSDFHLHSSFSSDSNTPLEQQITSAIQGGVLKELCITDHMDFDFPVNKDGFTFLFNIKEYLAEITRLKSIYSKDITINTGIELGLLPHLGNKLTSFLMEYGSYLDFIIGSSHLVKGLDPYEPEFFELYGEKEGIRLYLETIVDNMEAFMDFDVYGHLDYVVRYAPDKEKNYRPADYMDIFDIILKKLIQNGKGIELNTAGLKAGLFFAHPHPDVLKRYVELGGEIITVGSDAHKPEHLAYCFDKAQYILKEAVFSYYTVFHNRKPEFIKLS